ncbi:vancomycin high temperature exclusion protein [Rhodococcus sp. NPDC058505]|uniref:SanA/YdcF family protein n=1 Tax=unclassified Rhodococcus (in: high G+C Gram-positive bacteria) TaxID=192944 RepID=UPI003665A7AE
MPVDRRRRRRRLALGGGAVLAAGVTAAVGSMAVIAAAAAGRVHEPADAPEAPVVIVLGAKVQDGKPMSFLAGRLDVAAALVRDGKARAVLVSGDANGTSGNEIAAMTGYLVDSGIDRDLIVGDDHGLDTYDTCARAVQTFGVTRALIVSQEPHVTRAVALCRHAGMDVDGVRGDCDCRTITVARNTAREWLARPKAVLDMVSGRPPQVATPPTDALDRALASSAGG